VGPRSRDRRPTSNGDANRCGRSPVPTRSSPTSRRHRLRVDGGHARRPTPHRWALVARRGAAVRRHRPPHLRPEEFQPRSRLAPRGTPRLVVLVSGVVELALGAALASSGQRGWSGLARGFFVAVSTATSSSTSRATLRSGLDSDAARLTASRSSGAHRRALWSTCVDRRSCVGSERERIARSARGLDSRGLAGVLKRRATTDARRRIGGAPGPAAGRRRRTALRSAAWFARQVLA
jgi:hypothetical protein